MFVKNAAVVPEIGNEKVAMEDVTLAPRLFVRSSLGVHGQDAPVSPKSSMSFTVTVVPIVNACAKNTPPLMAAGWVLSKLENPQKMLSAAAADDSMEQRATKIAILVAFLQFIHPPNLGLIRAYAHVSTHSCIPWTAKRCGSIMEQGVIQCIVPTTLNICRNKTQISRPSFPCGAVYSERAAFGEGWALTWLASDLQKSLMVVP